MVVEILIAERNPNQPLADQRCGCVLNALRLAPVAEADQQTASINLIASVGRTQ